MTYRAVAEKLVSGHEPLHGWHDKENLLVVVLLFGQPRAIHRASYYCYSTVTNLTYHKVFNKDGPVTGHRMHRRTEHESATRLGRAGGHYCVALSTCPVPVTPVRLLLLSTRL